MPTGLEGIPTMDEFMQNLDRDQLSEGITVLEKYITGIKEKQGQAEDKLKETPTQEVECRAHIKQCNSCIQTARKYLQQYRNRYQEA